MAVSATSLWRSRRKPKGISVTFCRAAVISGEGRKWKWRLTDGDDRCGVARSQVEAIAAVDALYGRQLPKVIYGPTWREALAIASIVAMSFVILWIALAVRTGGF